MVKRSPFITQLVLSLLNFKSTVVKTRWIWLWHLCGSRSLTKVPTHRVWSSYKTFCFHYGLRTRPNICIVFLCVANTNIIHAFMCTPSGLKYIQIFYTTTIFFILLYPVHIYLTIWIMIYVFRKIFLYFFFSCTIAFLTHRE